jgi:hypothetical protein
MLRSATEEAYNVIADAIRLRRSLTANFDSQIWHFSPHVLGTDLDGKQVVLGFPYVADGLPLMGNWCFFRLDDLRDIIPNRDRWLTGPLQSVPSNLFRRIDLKV